MSTTHKRLYRKKTAYFCFILILFLHLYGCTKQTRTIEKGIYRIFDFNSDLNSLDLDNEGDLLIGTTDGELLFFNPSNNRTSSLQISNDKVFCSFQDSLGLFVGIRNEGLFFYPNNNISSKQRFKLSHKGLNYSVYEVDRNGDTLFCATSNGLAILNLSGKLSDWLTPIYPYRNTVPRDYKIRSVKCIRDTLYYVYSKNDTTTLFTSSLANGKINQPKATGRNKSFYSMSAHPDYMDNTLCQIWEDSIFIGTKAIRNAGEYRSLSYCKTAEHPFVFTKSNALMLQDQMSASTPEIEFRLSKSGKSTFGSVNPVHLNGYSYWVAGKTLIAIPDHCTHGPAISALSKSSDNIVAFSGKGVAYKQKGNKYRYDYTLKGFDAKSIDQVIHLENEQLCLLTDNRILIGAKGHKFQDVGNTFPQLRAQNIHCMAYDPKSERLFIGYRRGFAFFRLNKGIPDPSSYREDNSLQTVQCMLPITSSCFYIGTLNDGCIKTTIDYDNSVYRTTLINQYHDIIDIINIEDNYYYLTHNYLYGPTDSIDVHGLRIQKIFAYGNNMIFGISKAGGLYLFDRYQMTQISDTPLLSDIFFYPNAVQIQGNTLLAGTSIGLISVNLNNTSAVSHIEIKESPTTSMESFIRNSTKDVVTFGLLTILIIMLIVAGLIILTHKLKKRRDEIIAINSKLSSDKESLSKEIATKQTEIRNLSSDKESLSKEIATKQTEIRNLSSDKDSLSKEINNKKQEINELNKTTSRMERTIKDDRSLQIEDLAKHYLLNIAIEEKEHSTTLTAYEKEKKTITDKIKALRDKSTTFTTEGFIEALDKLKTSVSHPNILKAALQAELEDLSIWLKENLQSLDCFDKWHSLLEDKDNLKHIQDSIRNIRVNYLEKIIGFTKPNKPKTNNQQTDTNDIQRDKLNERQRYYLAIWAISLLLHYYDKDRERNLKPMFEDQTLLDILVSDLQDNDKDKDKDNDKTKNYIATLKSQMRASLKGSATASFSFTCRDNKYSEIYEQLVKVLGDHLKTNETVLIPKKRGSQANKQE